MRITACEDPPQRNASRARGNQFSNPQFSQRNSSTSNFRTGRQALHDLLPRSYAPKNAFSVHPAALVDPGSETLICFSHLRWDFVFQRPQHLMTRFAASRRVIYWEEPVAAPLEEGPSLDLKVCAKSGVVVATPHLPDSIQGEARTEALSGLLDGLIAAEKIARPIRWYYTPMMLGFSR